MAAQPQDAYFETSGDDGAAVVRQALRRDVNERVGIDRHSDRGKEETVDVLCECVDRSCAGRIAMSVNDYEAVRRFPTRFFIKEGHELSEGDRIVAALGGYVVIEKSGREGLYAVRSDPRRRRLHAVG